MPEDLVLEEQTTEEPVVIEEPEEQAEPQEEKPIETEEEPIDQREESRNLEADRVAAQARRKIDAMQRQLASIQKKYDDFTHDAGYDDFEKMRNALLEAKRNAISEKISNGDFSGLDDYIKSSVRSNPEIESLMQTKEELEAQRNHEVLMRDISELRDHFPDCGIKTEEDLFKLENAGDIINAARAGVPLYRAYAAYEMDTIKNTAQNAAKRAALNAQSKSHMKKTGGTGGKAGMPVPRDVYDQFKMINPTATDAEIAKAYNDYKNGGK